MKKIFGTVCALALTLGLGAAGPAATATTSTQPTAAATTRSTSQDHGFTMRQRWAREVTRFGDQDLSPYSIEHVRELQHRLAWVGTFTVGVTGNFGTVTRAALKKYQKREGLRQTGVAGHVTWAHLIHDTIRHRGAIPRICKQAGWHGCYDRSMHQVTLWHNGTIHNSWLVRGGAYDTPTRTGNTSVYFRDVDHVSHLPDAEGSPMPYAQFFDGGQAFHGSAYMIDPFDGHSHGCINMYIEDARQLWRIASTKPLHVTVYADWD